MIKSLRGMNDILSEDYERFTYFIDVASGVAKKYFNFNKSTTLILKKDANG